MHDTLELVKHKMKKKMRRMISIIKPLIYNNYKMYKEAY